MHTIILVGVIQAGGVLALRIFGTIALLGFGASGVLIYRRRHQFFDRDPEVLNDTPAVRHIRVEAVVIAGGAIMVALLGVLYEGMASITRLLLPLQLRISFNHR